MKSGSSKESGTLLYLKNLIDRRNVSRSVSMRLRIFINSHLVAAAFHFFSMEGLEDVPHANAFPSN